MEKHKMFKGRNSFKANKHNCLCRAEHFDSLLVVLHNMYERAESQQTIYRIGVGTEKTRENISLSIQLCLKHFRFIPLLLGALISTAFLL